VSREEVLNRIRQAEQKRSEMEAEALGQKEQTLREAQREARRILDEAAAQAEAEANGLVQAEGKKTLEELRRIVTAGEKEVSRQRDGSTARLPEAVDILYKEFLRQVNAQTP